MKTLSINPYAIAALYPFTDPDATEADGLPYFIWVYPKDKRSVSLFACDKNVGMFVFQTYDTDIPEFKAFGFHVPPAFKKLPKVMHSYELEWEDEGKKAKLITNNIAYELPRMESTTEIPSGYSLLERFGEERKKGNKAPMFFLTTEKITKLFDLPKRLKDKTMSMPLYEPLQRTILIHYHGGYYDNTLRFLGLCSQWNYVDDKKAMMETGYDLTLPTWD